jgi:hypothetical protein
LQGTNAHADQLGDLLSALSSLNEIPDLLDSFRRKLYRSSTNWGLRGKLFGLHHFCTLPELSPSVVARWWSVMFRLYLQALF